ncbi:MAG: PHP domain-containing protein [Lachnospiraceae bacterium]|nr:PHP domain-containing protein [Lachnospiraceae bacterium]
MIKFQAHRGVSTENPENTMPAFRAAVNQGYDVIELDVDVTKDGKFLLLHDSELNRTARKPDGSELAESVRISDITYEQALEYDYGCWFAKKFKGTKIPLLEEVLQFAAAAGINVKIDNKYQRFSADQKLALFALLKSHQEVAGLTCSSIEEIEVAAVCLSQMHFHYDGPVSAEILNALAQILPKDRLTVWLPVQNAATSWVKVSHADVSLAAMVKEVAGLGLRILIDYEELKIAERLGADIIETNGRLKPDRNQGLTADLHTHSESSHDSVCKIEDMCLAQMEKATDIMAVTDHCDIFSFNKYDIYTPIKAAYDTVMELRGKYEGKIRLLSGVEIGEGAWFPEETKKLMDLVPYDVIIGSSHCVKHKEITKAYSGIQFIAEDIDPASYFDDYLDELLAMLDVVDFDILAHLTCPLRYITGRQKIALDLKPYEEKITEILRRIIQSGIALEVNTSSYGLMGEFMPGREILQKYYDMGGYLITLGSDAHVTKDAAQYLDEAKALLREIGFKHIFYYENRCAHQITI